MSPEGGERDRRFLLAEWEAANLYRRLADVERDPARAALLRELSTAELGHAARWRDRLVAGQVLLRWRPSWRSRVLVAVARLWGSGPVLPLLEHLEAGEAHRYAVVPGADDLSMQERSHRRIFGELRRTPRVESLLAGDGRARPLAGGGNLRAVVFGINDGLVSNLSLVVGVAAAGAAQRLVLLAGIAGLLGGAFSMAAGEYISVLTQRERLQRELEFIHAALAEDPEEEEHALAIVYRARGFPAPEAARLARESVARKGTAAGPAPQASDIPALANPLGAALSSFVAFGTGAIIPVLPYLAAAGEQAAVISAALSGFALLAVGCTTALLTGRPFFYSGARMLFFGAAAATVTYLVGRLFGIVASG